MRRAAAGPGTRRGGCACVPSRNWESIVIDSLDMGTTIPLSSDSPPFGTRHRCDTAASGRSRHVDPLWTRWLWVAALTTTL